MIKDVHIVHVVVIIYRKSGLLAFYKLELISFGSRSPEVLVLAFNGPYLVWVMLCSDEGHSVLLLGVSLGYPRHQIVHNLGVDFV